MRVASCRFPGTEDLHRAARAVTYTFVERVAQARELARAANERCVMATLERGCFVGKLEQPRRAGLEARRVPDQAHRALADGDCPWLDPARHVSRLREDVTGDRARLPRSPRSRFHPPPRIAQLERSARRPQHVVFARHRDTEDGDRRIGGDALDAAAVPLHDDPNTGVPRGDELVQRFVVEPCDVTELERHD